MRDERGFSESVEWSLLAPALLLILLGAVQIATVWHARSVAFHAAATGAEVGSAHDASPGVAADAARRVAESSGLREVVVDVSRGGPDVRVRVAGRAPAVLDVATAVERTVTLPKEVIR